jgi:hypothetical protein
MNPEIGADLHKFLGGGLTAVVPHEVKIVASGPVGELAVDSHIQGLQTMICFRAIIGLLTDDLLRIPVEDDYDVAPPEVLDKDFGHIDAPPFSSSSCLP